MLTFLQDKGELLIYSRSRPFYSEFEGKDAFAIRGNREDCSFTTLEWLGQLQVSLQSLEGEVETLTLTLTLHKFVY